MKMEFQEDKNMDTKQYGPLKEYRLKTNTIPGNWSPPLGWKESRDLEIKISEPTRSNQGEGQHSLTVKEK